MILPDLNLLIYAYNLGAPDHVRSKEWWEDIMTRQEPVGLPVAVALGFIRLMTNSKVIQPPMPLAEAIEEVKRWLAAPQRHSAARYRTALGRTGEDWVDWDECVRRSPRRDGDGA